MVAARIVYSRATLLSFAVVAVLSACATPRGSSVETELVTFDADLVEQRLDGTQVRLGFRLNNPTLHRAHIGAVHWQANLDELGVEERRLKGSVAMDRHVEPGSSDEVDFELFLPLPFDEKTLAKRTPGTTVDYHVSASVEVMLANDRETYLAEWRGRFVAPRLPEITLSAEAGRYGDADIELNFLIGITNPNPFSIRVDGLAYRLRVDATSVAQGDLARGARLKPTSETQFPVHRMLAEEGHRDLVKNLISQNSIPYDLKGQLKAGKVAVDAAMNAAIEFAPTP